MKYLHISIIFFLSGTYVILSTAFGWVLGILGIFVLNIILCVLPGIFVTYKATIQYPSLIWVWRLGFSVLPILWAAFLSIKAPELMIIISYIGVAVLNIAIFYLVTFSAIERTITNEAT